MQYQLNSAEGLPIFGFAFPISALPSDLDKYVKKPDVVIIVWEAEPPGEPLFVIPRDEADLSVNNRKHQNAAHQEVRSPDFGFALPFSDSP